MPTPSESRPGPEESGTPRPAPRLKPVDRSQLLLRPVVVERLVAEDHPVRAIWEFVGRLDLSRYHDRVRSVEGLGTRQK